MTSDEVGELEGCSASTTLSAPRDRAPTSTLHGVFGSPPDRAPVPGYCLWSSYTYGEWKKALP